MCLCGHGNRFLPLIHQAKFDSMNKQMESMEMEVMEARLIRASELNGEMEDDNTGQTPCHLHNSDSDINVSYS